MAKYPENFKDNKFSYRNIGKLVDRNFCLLLRLKKKTFEKLEYAYTIDRKYLKQYNSIFFLYRMFGRLLKRPYLWKSLGRTLLSRIKTTFPYIRRRLFPGGGTASQDSSLLPAMFSKNIVIDPVAFFYKKQTIKSHKTYHPSPLHGGLANLLWHILSRCAVIASFITLDVPEGRLYSYFKQLRQFFKREWRDKVGAAEFKLAHLDAVIIEKVTELVGKDTRFSPWKQIADIEKIAIDIFKEYRFKEDRGETFFDFMNPSSSHNTAVNCSYMQI